MTLPDPAAAGIAESIAAHLCATALEYEGRCTWLGMVQDAGDASDLLEFSLETLPPDLYGGTSGVALFLAEVAASSGDARLRRVAEGAMRQAFARMESIDAERRFGFYAGVVGLAWAGVRVGGLLGREEFVARARQALLALPPDREEECLLDVIGGAAGAIPVLLPLAEELAAPELTDCAMALGERLLATANRSADGWSWDETATGFETARDLTGFAHGAAGIGRAFLELHASRGDPRYLEGAREAIRYESHWFRADRDNWPDFRRSDGDEEPEDFAMAWCHGAPGIGLARARASALLGTETYRPDVVSALRSTVQQLRLLTESPARDLSPCHGGVGVAECALFMAETLEDEEGRQATLQFAEAAAARYGTTPAVWPVGVARGSTPSLMLGLAGIGRFYLRLAAPDVPSMLLPGPVLL